MVLQLPVYSLPRLAVIDIQQDVKKTCVCPAQNLTCPNLSQPLIFLYANIEHCCSIVFSTALILFVSSKQISLDITFMIPKYKLTSYELPTSVFCCKAHIDILIKCQGSGRRCYAGINAKHKC